MGLKTNPDKIEAVAEWPMPIHKQVQHFLRFANIYWQSIKNYNQTTIPLTQLSSPTRHLVLKDEQRCPKVETTVYYSSCSQTAPPHRQFILETDESDPGVGVILS